MIATPAYLISKLYDRCLVSGHPKNLFIIAETCPGTTLKIIKDGKISKFVKRVYKIVYSGSHGVKKGQKVLFVTERAVFKLGDKGIELIEVAPEVDIEKDILAKMEFKPRILNNVEYMNKELFNDKPMNLRSLINDALRK